MGRSDSAGGLVSGTIREQGLLSDSTCTSVLLSDWLLCVGGVAVGGVTGKVWVGVDVGVGLEMEEEVGMSLLGLT